MESDLSAILANAQTRDTQLREHINKTHEVNRLIAAHPSVSSETLEEMIDFWGESDDGKDGETCRLAVQSANASVGILRQHGRKYPEALWANPSFERLLDDDPELLYSMPEALAAANCPISVMEAAAKDRGLVNRAYLLLNQNLPKNIAVRLSSEILSREFSENLEKFIGTVKDSKFKQYLSFYKETRRRFCMPRFVNFDRHSEIHRKSDQVLAGFPFTSNRWPWPIGKNGAHMQPIVQLDLENAGTLLSEDLGFGVIQVWGGVDSREFVKRVIPRSDLDEDMDVFYPEDAPWLALDSFGDAEMEGCMVSPFAISDYHPFAFNRCAVEWVPFGSMYYPSLTKRVLYPLPRDRALSDFDEKLERRLERLDEKLNDISVPTGMYPGINLLCRLGGYTDGLGNTWDRFQDPLLFYHSIDTGIKVTIGVTYKRLENGDVDFSVAYACDN